MTHAMTGSPGGGAAETNGVQRVTEHTPTPWSLGLRWREELIVSGDDVVCRAPHNPDNSENWKANAAFIVKAVNNHDALVAALREVEALSDNCVNAERYGAEDALEDLQAIRSAIKRHLVIGGL